MPKFVDAKGNVVDTITKDNLAAFREYVKNTDFSVRGQDYSLYLKFDGVEVADLFTNKKGEKIKYPEFSQVYLGRVIGTTGNSNKAFLQRAAESLLDMAAENPRVLKEAFETAGNFGNGDFYNIVAHVVKDRTISQNLPALLVLDGHQYLSLGRIECEPSKKDVEFFEKFYLKEKELGYYNQEMMRKIIETGFFANAKLSPALRKEHNLYYFHQLHVKDLQDRVLHMKTEHFDMETAANIVFNYSMTYFNTVIYGRPDSKGRVSDFDKKMQEILLTLTHKTEPHDRANDGKEKTLNQRFKETMVNLWNIYSKKDVKSFEEIPEDNRNGIVFDIYLKSAMYDIRNGRAGDLDKQALQTVLANDKRGYYFKMLPPELIVKHSLLLNSRQSELRMFSREQFYEADIQMLPYLSHLSLKEKEDTLAKIALEQSNNAEFKEKYSDVVKSAGEEREVIELMRKDLSDKNNSWSTISFLQDQYAKIMNNIEGETVNSAEAGLLKEVVNRRLADATIAEYVPLKMPEYGRLPLFGRAKEQERRAKLAEEIRKFNELVDKRVVHREMIPNYDSLSQYAEEGLLLTKVAEMAEKDVNNMRRVIKNADDGYKAKYHVSTYEPLEGKIKFDKIVKREEALTEAQKRVAEKKHAMKAQAAANVLPPKESNLKSAEGLPDEEKRAVRAENAKITDPLKKRMEKSQQK